MENLEIISVGDVEQNFVLRQINRVESLLSSKFDFDFVTTFVV